MPVSQKLLHSIISSETNPALLFLRAKGCHDTTDGIEGWPSRNNSCKTQKAVGGGVIFGRLFGLVTWGFLCS